jgi:hypothetical protein
VSDDHEDYQPAPKSQRHLVADEVARLVKESGLAEVYGGKVDRHPEGKCYRIAFSKKRTVDGQVSVYNPGYITVNWRTTNAGMEPEGRRIFASLEEAITFLQFAFVDGDAEAANAVPQYEPKRRKKQETKDVQQQRDQQRATPEAHLPGSFAPDEFSGDRPAPADDRAADQLDLTDLF